MKKRDFAITLFGLLIFASLLTSCSIGEPATGELNETPLEEVREQASDVFLTNEESVDAEDIDVGLG